MKKEIRKDDEMRNPLSANMNETLTRQ
jgi:hypothetical protein